MEKFKILVNKAERGDRTVGDFGERAGGFSGRNSETGVGANSWDVGERMQRNAVNWDDLAQQPDFAMQKVVGQTGSAQAEMRGYKEGMVERNEAQRSAEFAKKQRKIMMYFEASKPHAQEIIQAKEVTLPENWQQDFMREMAEGQISGEAEVDFLLQIKPRMRQVAPETILHEVLNETASGEGGNVQHWSALRQMTNGEVDANGIRKLTEAPEEGRPDFRTPVGFWQFRREFMQPVSGNETVYRQRERALDDLERKLYGDQSEYYHAFEDLRQQARTETFERSRVREHEQRFGQKILRAFGSRLRNWNTKRAASESSEISENLESRERQFENAANDRPEQISREEAERILVSAVIDGDPWEYNGEARNLTPEMLRNIGLEPKFESSAHGSRVYLSEVYQLPKSRQAAVAYVPTDRGVKVRSYYKSNSQGLWRYMPDYVRASDGSGRANLIGKGYDEASVTLSAELQKSLAQIEQIGVRNVVEHTHPFFPFAGTAKAYDSRVEYEHALDSNTLRGDYYREVSSEPLDLGFEMFPGHKSNPEQLRLPDGLKPDFSQKVLEYDNTSSLAGKFQAECFRSEDGDFTWSFCNDEKGHVWIGGVDVKTTPTSTGVGKDWVQLADYTTPIYEYPAQDSGYGDQSDRRGGGYVGMWKNYLSKVPIIREYVQRRNARKSR